MVKRPAERLEAW